MLEYFTFDKEHSVNFDKATTVGQECVILAGLRWALIDDCAKTKGRTQIIQILSEDAQDFGEMVTKDRMWIKDWDDRDKAGPLYGLLPTHERHPTVEYFNKCRKEEFYKWGIYTMIPGHVLTNVRAPERYQTVRGVLEDRAPTKYDLTRQEQIAENESNEEGALDNGGGENNTSVEAIPEVYNLGIEHEQVAEEPLEQEEELE